MLGNVRSRTQSGQDVPAAYAGLRDRLDAARAERESLLGRVARAGTDTQAEPIRRRWDLVATGIGGLRGQLRDLRVRTNHASVSVTLVEDGAHSYGAGGDFGDALDEVTGSLAASGQLALRALGIALPLCLLGLLGWWTARAVLRRRRESGLV